MSDRIFAIAGIAIGLMAWFSPYLWPKLPVWVAQVGMLLGVFILGIAIGFLIKKRGTPALKDTASLSFHCYGDTRTPQRIAADNIWRWYYLRNIFILVDIATQAQTSHVQSTLFISFDDPVKIGSLEVSSPDFVMPKFEVKEFNNRFAIVVFSEELPLGTLSINVRI